MKIKKYSFLMVFTILMLMIGVKGVFAESSKKCYYMAENNEFKATLRLSWGYGCAICHGLNAYAKVTVNKSAGKFQFNDESILNWWSGMNWRDKCTADDKVCFSEYYKNSSQANKDSNPDCPKYLVFQHCTMYGVWATESESQAERAVKGSRESGCTAYYASSEDKSGNLYTKEDYYAEFQFEGIIDFNEQGEPTCADFDAIFGDKNDPNSLRSLIDTILGYVRIIVPILVILLGTLDFAKAVIAGKEDNIKKYQTDFIKRVIIGVAVFFVPLLVDLVMDLADIVWAGDYIHCKL